MIKLPFRSLAALANTASTSRVLNLGVIAQRSGHDLDYIERPLFRSGLNQSIILKHNLRRNERDLFDDRRQYATKILIPFDWKDLGLGGRSIFFGQKDFRQTVIEELGLSRANLSYDENILMLLDQLPSLDPFLMREHLRRNNIKVSPCYFDISKADFRRMQQFVADELKDLIMRASGSNRSVASESLGRMVSAILSTEVDEKLEPLRKAIGMEVRDFREGAFSWKGFLYYKWSLAELDLTFAQTLMSMRQLDLRGPADQRVRYFISKAIEQLTIGIQKKRASVRTALRVYDDAFIGLVQRGDARAFREFLLNAPGMFIDIGEQLGAISHICSFWRYRFPPGEPPEMTADEADDFFREYDIGLSSEARSEINWGG